MKKNNLNKTYKVAVKKVNSKVLTFNHAFVSRKSYNDLVREHKDLSDKFVQLGLNPDEEVTCYRRQCYNKGAMERQEVCSWCQEVCSWCSTTLTKDMRYCPYCGRKIIGTKSIVSLQASL